MPKIQSIGLGNFIRNPRGTGTVSGGLKSREVMQVTTNNGNSFTCYPVMAVNPLVLDKTRYLQIPIDTDVESASI